ncbi:MAG: DUF4355 domain-containing protein [Candidatus Methanoperedens sp.]|nr:DUF4355 domain-containing protein [Candidatus Methanoperedens sp.]
MEPNEPPKGDTGSPNNPSPGNDKEGQPPADDKKTFTQEEINSILAKERRVAEKTIKELQQKAKDWDKYQESQKSEHQKLQERVVAAEKERDALKLSYELDKAKPSIFAKYAIPPDHWKFIPGTTEEELNENAKEYAKVHKFMKVGGETPPGGNPATGRNPFNQIILDATGRGR